MGFCVLWAGMNADNDVTDGSKMMSKLPCHLCSDVIQRDPDRNEPDRRERGRSLVLVPAAFHVAGVLQEGHSLVQPDRLHAKRGPGNEAKAGVCV